MPTEIAIPSVVITGLQVIIAFIGAFVLALWISLIIWTFRDARLRSRDVFAILLATLMVTIFGPLGLILYFLLRPPTTLAELYERSLEEEALLQDLEERPTCPTCSRQVQDVWVVCPDCHSALKKPCGHCGKSLDLGWNICPYCGTLVTESAPHTHDHTPATSAPQEVVDVPEAFKETRPVEAQPATEAKPEAAQPEPEPTPNDSPKPVPTDETRPQVPEAGAA